MRVACAAPSRRLHCNRPAVTSHAPCNHHATPDLYAPLPGAGRGRAFTARLRRSGTAPAFGNPACGWPWRASAPGTRAPHRAPWRYMALVMPGAPACPAGPLPPGCPTGPGQRPGYGRSGTACAKKNREKQDRAGRPSGPGRPARFHPRPCAQARTAWGGPVEKHRAEDTTYSGVRNEIHLFPAIQFRSGVPSRPAQSVGR